MNGRAASAALLVFSLWAAAGPKEAVHGRAQIGHCYVMSCSDGGGVPSGFNALWQYTRASGTLIER